MNCKSAGTSLTKIEATPVNLPFCNPSDILTIFAIVIINIYVVLKPRRVNNWDELHRILIYQIDSFYVEVNYNRQHNAIVRFRAFASPEQLLPYLGKINIDELLKDN